MMVGFGVQEEVEGCCCFSLRGNRCRLEVLMTADVGSRDLVELDLEMTRHARRRRRSVLVVEPCRTFTSLKGEKVPWVQKLAWVGERDAETVGGSLVLLLVFRSMNSPQRVGQRSPI